MHSFSELTTDDCSIVYVKSLDTASDETTDPVKIRADARVRDVMSEAAVLDCRQ